LLNGFIAAIFAGYKEATKDKKKQLEYEGLLHTPFLNSPEYLMDLYNQAENEEQRDCIIDHINRHKVYEIGAYGDLYNKHIDERWK